MARHVAPRAGGEAARKSWLLSRPAFPSGAREELPALGTPSRGKRGRWAVEAPPQPHCEALDRRLSEQASSLGLQGSVEPAALTQRAEQPEAWNRDVGRSLCAGLGSLYPGRRRSWEREAETKRRPERCPCKTRPGQRPGSARYPAQSLPQIWWWGGGESLPLFCYQTWILTQNSGHQGNLLFFFFWVFFFFFCVDFLPVFLLCSSRFVSLLP